MHSPGNMFADIPSSVPAEIFQTLQSGGGVRIERILSQGQASPDWFWYDQPHDEWVLVLQGAARLTLEGQLPIEMRAGSFLNIPAHQKHRVDWTDPGQVTVWLAVHFGDA